MAQGFGIALSPQQEIKNFRHNVRALNPHNIAETVSVMREEWDKDYGRRDMGDAECSVESLFAYKEPEVIGNTFVATRRRIKGTQVHFAAIHGHWSLMIYTMSDGKEEYSFNVDAGVVRTWHPQEAKNCILKRFPYETYCEWKRVVSSTYEESSNWLMAEAKKVMPGYRCWSITANESSSRLMRRTSGIYVVSDVAFLFL
jgi:hypothetical protein